MTTLRTDLLEEKSSVRKMLAGNFELELHYWNSAGQVNLIEMKNKAHKNHNIFNVANRVSSSTVISNLNSNPTKELFKAQVTR